MDDAISRQAAIDSMMEILDRPNHAEFLYTDEICNALNRVPSVHWTSCSERLPETTGEYYVTWTAPICNGKRFVEIIEFTAPEPECDEDGYLVYPGEDEVGDWETYDIDLHYKGVEILAWMPIPQPYDGE